MGDKKASCPPRREESVNQKTLECKAKSKTQGEREKKMQKEQSEKVQRGKRRNIGRVAARTVTIVVQKNIDIYLSNVYLCIYIYIYIS